MAAAVLMQTVSFRGENSHGDWQVLGRDEPKKKVLVKQTSMMQSERDISMDPISINSLSLSPSLRRNDSFDMVLRPAMSPPRDLDSPMPLPLQPVRTKSNRSLPNSTTSSPKQRSGLMRALKGREPDSSSGLLRALKSKDQDSSSSSGLLRALKSKDQDSSSSSGLMRALKRKEQDSSSSSSGLLRALKGKEQDSSSGLVRALKGKEQDTASGLMRALKGKEQDSSLSSASLGRSNSCVATSKRLSPKSSGNSFLIKTDSNKNMNNNNSLQDGFKCNALCLFLPGFGKGKPVRSSRKDDSDSSSFTRTTTRTTSSTSSVTVSRTVSVRETTTTTTVMSGLSARASMEKFDCNSYSSEYTGDEAGSHFFDLPAELIKTSSGENDQDDPVSAAFVFDKEPVEKEIKGVLKVSGSNNRKSMETSLRHVRFSTTSPVSYPTSPAISPRLLEATKNFNAFLDAQAV